MDASLKLVRRDIFGKKARQLVEDGNALANIFGKGEESVAAMGPVGQIEKLVTMAGKSTPINITLDDGKEYLVLVDDVERDAITRRVHHVTFKIVIKGQKIVAEVPVRIVGDAPAARKGMILVTIGDTVEVEAIPSKLPEAVEVSVDGLEEDSDQVTVADVIAMPDVVVKSDPELVLAKIETPRAQAEDADEETDEESAGEVPSDHGGAKEEPSED